VAIAQTYSYVYTNFGPFILIFVSFVSLYRAAWNSSTD